MWESQEIHKYTVCQSTEFLVVTVYIITAGFQKIKIAEYVMRTSEYQYTVAVEYSIYYYILFMLKQNIISPCEVRAMLSHYALYIYNSLAPIKPSQMSNPILSVKRLFGSKNV